MPANSHVLALDVGSKRVGVAIASTAARLPRPLTTLDAGANLLDRLQYIINDEAVEAIVVGLPRGLSGQSTAQTAAVETFTDQLRRRFDKLPIYFQDEALTSQQAETELRSRKTAYNKAEVDSLAAVYILEDWLAGQTKETKL